MAPFRHALVIESLQAVAFYPVVFLVPVPYRLLSSLLALLAGFVRGKLPGQRLT